MSDILRRGAYSAPVDQEQVRRDWADEGFNFGVFRDPPGQEWNDFVHDSDEYLVVAAGAMEVRVGAQCFEAAPGDLVRIPRNTLHSLRTLSAAGSVWLYGYGFWGQGDD